MYKKAEKKLVAFILVIATLFLSNSFAFFDFSELFALESLAALPVSEDSEIENDVVLPAAEESEAIHKDKNLITDEDGNLGLQIDVWTEGIVTTLPTEIVFVVDQSGSMFQTSGNNRPFNPQTNPEGYMTYEQFIQYADIQKGQKYPGYYMAVTKNINYGTSETDYNGTSCRNAPHAVAIVKYDETDGWMRSNQVVLNDGGYDSLEISPTWKNITAETISTLNFNKIHDASLGNWTANYDNSYVKFYKSLYGATLDAYETFVDEVSGIKNARIAIVGFSSPESYGERWDASRSSFYGGTGVIVNGEFIHASKNPDYGNVWMPTETEEDINNIRASIGEIFSNYNETCTQDGFRLANEILAASEEENANRFVLVFTDGEPTAATNTPYGQSGDGVGHNEAITESKLTKEKASVYVFGPSSLTNGNTTAETFLEYLSSDYDNAVSLTESGERTGKNYYGIAGDSAHLEQTFKDVGQAIFEASNALNTQTEIRDTVTQYFDIDGGFNSGEVKVYNVPFVATENNTFEFETDENKWDDITDEVTLNIEGQTVTVSNYNFSKNSLHPSRAGGNKLVIRIPIVRDPEFIGGNHVDTNTPDSGIYMADGQPAAYFPVPETDVELTEIIAEVADMNIYLGGKKTRTFTVADLEHSAFVSVNGIVLDLSKHDGHYGLDWQDDYARVQVVLIDEDGNEFTDGFSDLREDTVYSIKVTAVPVYEGSEHSIGTSNQAKISVFYPELTFKDSYHTFGDPVPSEDSMSANNYISAETRWVNADGVYSEDVTMSSSEIPQLTLSYALAHSGNTLNKLNIPVDVTVNSSGYAENVQNYCRFKWESCNPECGFSIATHFGNAASYEFYLHMNQYIASDCVVIDYGLPVKISVLANDGVEKSGSITAIGASLAADTQLENTGYTESRLIGGTTDAALANGNAAIEGEKIVYTPSNLEMSSENVFYYEYKTSEGEYLYATVTVIPASIVYYEDSFITFNDSGEYKWQTEGTTYTDKFQAEDRPGTFSLSEFDANNVYGYDEAYNDNSVTYSMGSAVSVEIDSGSNANPPTAEFTFCGTGFDLFSVTNNETGATLVSVYDLDSNKRIKNYIVQTYYGYTYDVEEDKFTPNLTSTDGLYQIPIITSRDFEYGTYKVVITPQYSSKMDMNYDKTGEKHNSYKIYVDSVRIYNPAGTNPDVTGVIGEAYINDGEYMPEFSELRNDLIAAETFYSSVSKLDESIYTPGAVFIDGISDVDSGSISSKFLESGPNNEVYLAKGQAIAFYVQSDKKIHPESLKLGMKIVAGNANGELLCMNSNSETALAFGINGSHEMYCLLNDVIVWDSVALKNEGVYRTKYPVILVNNSDSIISLTNISFTYAENDNTPSAQGFSLAVTSSTPEIAMSRIKMLSAAEEPVIPEETTTPEETDSSGTEEFIIIIIITLLKELISFFEKIAAFLLNLF